MVLASFLGWMLDAFDFFLVVFVFSRIAGDFGTDVKNVTYALFLTLAMRPDWRVAFRPYGRSLRSAPGPDGERAAYSIMELASAFAPSLKVFLVLRALYGDRHGWRMGRRGLTGVRNRPGEFARHCFRDAAGRLSLRLSAGSGGLRAAL